MVRPESSDTPEVGDARASRRWVVPMSILVVVALLVIGVFLLSPGEDEPEQAEHGASDTGAAQGVSDDELVPERGAVEDPSDVELPDLTSEEGRDPDDLLAEGPVDAPVVMVVFTDFQCSYCAQWTHETLPVLRDYVERGELRIEYRDVNIYGEGSERAARASLAAAMQGKHEEYQRALFEDGEIRSEGELTQESLVALAGELGLDTEQFVEDVNSEEVDATIQENAQQGIDLGAMSTPAFLVGGEPMVGAQPADVFTGAVDDALTEAGS